MNTPLRSYSASVSLHAAVAVGLSLYLLRPVETPEMEAPVRILTLVAGQQSVSAISDETSAVQSVKMPAVPHIKPVTRSAPEEWREPAQIDSAAPKILHAVPRTRGGSPPTSQRVSVTRLNPADYSLGSTENSRSPENSEGQVLDPEFVSTLIELLRSGYKDRDVAYVGLATFIEFRVRADGNLDCVRLIESSGSNEYDASVRAAIDRVRISNVPAAVVGKIYRVHFRAINPQ